jgi:hypothetical protein
MNTETMSPLDVAENTETMYTPEEIVKMGQSLNASFSYIPGGNGAQTVDDWR